MKFGKRLKKQVEESLPEWRDKFLAYKRLKRLVRLVPSSSSPRRRAAEAAFVRLLDGEVDRFNAFFLEQEEDFVIRHRARPGSPPAWLLPYETQFELQEAVKKVAAGDREAAAEVRRVRREVVDLHGKMVLLLNYSAINYTGLAKILKKYDKCTGRLLRQPFIEKVLGQPFFATELISRLVRECEATMEAVFEAGGGCSGAGATPVAAAATTEQQGIFRNTVAALVTMGELRSGSSTYGHFSLPPMASPESDLLRCVQVADPVPI
ncbi:hypothetical protein C2845_PM01G44570 [Panicum miliaceum]|uniref:SPX domain-containing protein n=1 Tax=Panicum miliaceum TaxID=4540 RepID=A0A3L6TLJ6_PANMI|nr:hypothetical protein C2845_PM01G44570 [Panicum miliaceum]